MPKFNIEFWKKLTSLKPEKKTKEQSNEKEKKASITSREALGDALSDEPPGGDDPDAALDDSSSKDSSEADGESSDSGEDTGSSDEFGMDDSGMDFGGDSGEGDSSSDSGGDSSSSVGGFNLEDRKVGENPFGSNNGRELIIQKIQELITNIDSTIEAVSKLPKVSSVIVNNLMELKDITSKLVETVYLVPLEETIVRYKLCVQTYKLQVTDLSKSINDLMIKHHNTEEI